MATQYSRAAPGVYFDGPQRPQALGLRTGVPVFLGWVESQEVNKPLRLTLWTPGLLPKGYLAAAVHGFFANGGKLCYVVPLAKGVSHLQALQDGLAAIEPLEEVDLVCAPNAMGLGPGDKPDPVEVQTLQQEILRHCDRLNDRMAILDALPKVDPDKVLAQRRGLKGANGTLYYPWIHSSNGDRSPDDKLPPCGVPPCGHVAGVYAATDQDVGVHKAPANVALADAIGLERSLANAEQGPMNEQGVNVLRAFPGRGLRIWGARTLATDANWRYVNVRRVFLTLGRWVAQNLPPMTFEPNDPRLWARIHRELTAYLTVLFRRGALRGRQPQDGFYVKCDAETNPAEVRDACRVVTEIGLAPALPGEFIVVRIVHGDSGITLSEPTQPA